MKREVVSVEKSYRVHGLVSAMSGSPSWAASTVFPTSQRISLRWPHAKWPGYEHEAMTFFGLVVLADLDPDAWPGPAMEC
jgi:hypothetical protein